jgi:excinuclease ABC subunit B
LRSETALIQTCGHAARNAEGRVIMYADKMTKSIQKTLEITNARRLIQENYNKEHGITPKTVVRTISVLVEDADEIAEIHPHKAKEAGLVLKEAEEEYITPEELHKKIKECEKEMLKAAKEMRFEEAAHFRDQLRKYQQIEITLT